MTREDREARHLCRQCDRPANGSLCDKHKELQRGRNGRRRGPAKTCAYCGRVGHNSRSHRR